MPMKGTILTRRPQTKLQKMSGEAVIIKMIARFNRENPQTKFTYQALVDVLKKISPADVEISKSYLCSLRSKDCAVALKIAQVIAQYLNIEVEDIEICKKKPRCVTEKAAVAKPAPEVKTNHCLSQLAVFFISKNPNLSTADFGVGCYK